MHSCNYFSKVSDSLAITFKKCQIQSTNLDLSRLKFGSRIDQTKDLIFWTADMPCRPLGWLQYPHGPAPSPGPVQSATKKSRRAGRNCPLRWAITLPRHGPRGIRAACKQRKRHVTCSKIARLHALLPLSRK